MKTNEVIQQLESINSGLELAIRVMIFAIGFFAGIFIKDAIEYFITQKQD